MTREYLKKASLTSKSDASEVHETVQNILADIEAGGDATAMEYARKFDRYEGNVLLTAEEIEAACALVPEKLKKDIQFSHDNVKRFAETQKGTVANVEMEIVPGMIAGQKAIPVDAAGCYVPGGRYSHIASAIMTVTTAKVAGCLFVFLWVRATFPRYRYDQLMRLGWKVFLPFSLLWVVVTAGVLIAFDLVPNS